MAQVSHEQVPSQRRGWMSDLISFTVQATVKAEVEAFMCRRFGIDLRNELEQRMTATANDLRNEWSNRVERRFGNSDYYSREKERMLSDGSLALNGSVKDLTQRIQDLQDEEIVKVMKALMDTPEMKELLLSHVKSLLTDAYRLVLTPSPIQESERAS